MPRKNSVKVFLENSIYHIYNRGVDKRIIFNEDRDYRTFLYLLKKYLSPSPKNKPFKKKETLSDEISLLAYCLMPNHFHLLVKQKSKNGITKLVRKICTNYVMYFNSKNDRSGSLFEGIYKAIIVDNDEYLIHLSRYIHLNPNSSSIEKVETYPYSSFPYFVGSKQAKWVKPKQILDHFNKKRPSNAYRNFVKDYQKKDLSQINTLLLEEG